MSDISMTWVADTINTVFGAFDMFFFKLFGNTQNDYLTSIEKIITFLGDAKFIFIVMLASVFAMLFKRTRKLGICVLISLTISTVITNILLKPAVMRPRPYIFFEDNPQFMTWYKNVGSPLEKDFSFPSGHTTAAFSYCISAFLCLKDKYKIAYILSFVAVLVMISRVYLMVHFASDVIFGMIVGTSAAVIAYKITDKVYEDGKIRIGRQK